MSTQLGQITKKAKLDRQVRFTSLPHLLTPAFLKETWRMMNRKAASGIDGESTEQMLRSRSWAGSRLAWGTFHQIKQRTPLQRPKLRLPYRELQALAVL